MNIYLAGSIFYEGDRLRNTLWSSMIREIIPNVNLYNPLENSSINDKSNFADSILIADGDNNRLDNTDVLVACLDGDVIPSGTSAEIGKFHEKIERGDHKYIIGIASDSRMAYKTHSKMKTEVMENTICESQYCYQNLYTVGLIKQCGYLFDNIYDTINKLVELNGEYEVGIE